MTAPFEALTAALAGRYALERELERESRLTVADALRIVNEAGMGLDYAVYFKVNPVVDPLRGEPRFQALVARIGL